MPMNVGTGQKKSLRKLVLGEKQTAAEKKFNKTENNVSRKTQWFTSFLFAKMTSHHLLSWLVPIERRSVNNKKR
jgi:hypothetical protein